MQTKRKFTVKNGNGVKEFHFEDQTNSQYRKTMEDYFFVHDRYLDTCAKSILFGMFDGHGGDKVSSYLAKNFSTILLHQIKNCKKNIKSAFERAYNVLDQKIRSQIPQCDQMGSTSTVGLILYQQSHRVLYITHVGDSSAFLFDDKNAEKLTLQHRGENLAQKQRVKQIQIKNKKCRRCNTRKQVSGRTCSHQSFRRFWTQKTWTNISSRDKKSRTPSAPQIFDNRE